MSHMTGVWDPHKKYEVPPCTEPCRKPEPHSLGSDGCDFTWTYEDGIRVNPDRPPSDG